MYITVYNVNLYVCIHISQIYFTFSIWKTYCFNGCRVYVINLYFELASSPTKNYISLKKNFFINVDRWRKISKGNVYSTSMFYVLHSIYVLFSIRELSCWLRASKNLSSKYIPDYIPLDLKYHYFELKYVISSGRYNQKDSARVFACIAYFVLLDLCKCCWNCRVELNLLELLIA